MMITLEKLQKDIIKTIRSITESPEKQWDQIVLKEEREGKEEEVVTFDVAMSYLPMNEYGQTIYSNTITNVGKEDEVESAVDTQLPLVREALRSKTVHGLLSNMKNFMDDPVAYLQDTKIIQKGVDGEDTERDLNQVEMMQRSFASLMAYKIILETLVNFETRSSGKNLEFISAGLMGGAVPSDTVI